MKLRIKDAFIAGAIAFAVTAAVGHLRATPYNNYVLLAQAFLSGHTWIQWPGAYIDALPYSDGHYYVIEAPLPGILMMPLVALFGTHANQTILSVVLCAVGIGAAWQLGERFGLSTTANAWICGFLLAGTDFLWCAMLGDVWFIAHVSAVCFTMLALAELAGKKRAWLVALWAVCAFESRFSMIAAVPVYLYLLFAENAQWRKSLAGLAAVFVPAAIFWVWYNQARWGTWNDIGYTAWYHQDQAGSPTGSPFRLEYFAYEVQSFFVNGPTRLPAFPYFRPEMTGIALTWTSPALILAILARKPARWTIALWVAALLTAVPNFLYYVNGFAQFGMRHALDFEPFLVALMMLGVRDRFPAWGYALVAYSMLVGFWGCWYWNAFIRV